MKKTYVINGRVRFDPWSRTLSVIGKSGHAVQLYAPVSECLLLLLLHNGKTVSQSYLSEEVWEKKGNYVTPNSLYQNIAAIRRAFKAVGLEEAILKTIPKSGFQIYVVLEEVEVPPDDKALPEEPLYQEDTMETSVSVPGRRKRITQVVDRVKFAHLLLLSIFIYGCVLLYTTMLPPENILSSYSHIGKFDKCDVYSSFSGVDKSQEIFYLLLGTGGIKCPVDGKAYLTFNTDAHLSSLLLCDKDIEVVTVNCRSMMFSGALNEKKY